MPLVNFIERVGERVRKGRLPFLEERDGWGLGHIGAVRRGSFVGFY